MKLHFFRGITVPANTAVPVMDRIRESGLHSGDGKWVLPFPTVRDEEDEAVTALKRKGELEYQEDELSVCACADEDSAAYYALTHNRHGDCDTPVIIEFEANAEDVAVDGRDMLYTLFQLGDPDRAPDAIRTVYGDEALRHLEAAWGTDNQFQRLAHCDRAVLDPAVVAHHYRNRIVIEGRHKTVFSSAFQVRLPVKPSAIRGVRVLSKRPISPNPEIWFERLVRRGS